MASERTPHLFTVLGPAGVGKSRLSDEFLTSLAGAGVLRGQCLSYGNGITFWPVVEILVQLLGKEPATRLEELGVDTVAGARIASSSDAEARCRRWTMFSGRCERRSRPRHCKRR